MLQEGRTAEDCLTDSTDFTARKGIAKLSHIPQAPRSVKLFLKAILKYTHEKLYIQVIRL